MTTKAFTTEFHLNSQVTQTQVIELYTSQGCSSCPPADRWLSSLKSSPKLFRNFIPMAFHVDYWDYIGWKDELALDNNSKRQRLYKHYGNLNSVYTPGVVKAGKEWRSWYGSMTNKSKTKVGQLFVDFKNNKLNAKFDAFKKTEYTLFVALLGMNLKTKVKAGENHGKTLTHDFVVLKQKSFGSSKGVWHETVSEEFFKSKHPNTAFVAWVEKTNNPTPVQAVATFL